MSVIRVLIADDHPLICSALRMFIEDETDLELVGEVDNGRDAVIQALTVPLDVVVVDLYLPVVDGIEVIKQVTAANPSAKLLVLTSSLEEAKVADAVLAGALGYLAKDSDRSEILHAIREVGQGRACLSPIVATKLARSLHNQHALRPVTGEESLTSREHEILEQIGGGASNAVIARNLHISENTVRTHIHNILQKMGFATRSQLMMVLLSQKNRQA